MLTCVCCVSGFFFVKLNISERREDCVFSHLVSLKWFHANANTSYTSDQKKKGFIENNTKIATHIRASIRLLEKSRNRILYDVTIYAFIFTFFFSFSLSLYTFLHILFVKIEMLWLVFVNIFYECFNTVINICDIASMNDTFFILIFTSGLVLMQFVVFILIFFSLFFIFIHLLLIMHI